MTETVSCCRCGQNKPGLSKAPRVDAVTASEILEKVCAGCWKEWQDSEVMVINELKLNFMDPASIDTLTRHMREFLLLDGPAPAPGGLPTAAP